MAALVVKSARRCPMTERPNRQILLAERPKGKLEESHFKAIDSTIGDPSPGELLVRTILLSIDPANRAWRQGRAYRQELGAGGGIAGGAPRGGDAGHPFSLPQGSNVVCEAGGEQYPFYPANRVMPR